MTKLKRHQVIENIIREQTVSSQDELLTLLADMGFDLTQATLSRDIKELKIVKTPTADGTYAYRLPNAGAASAFDPVLSSIGFVNVEFSGNLAVIKTRPGYAMAIAGEIDAKAQDVIIGTVAGDDTILLIPKESISREDVKKALASFIPNII